MVDLREGFKFFLIWVKKEIREGRKVGRKSKIFSFCLSLMFGFIIGEIMVFRLRVGIFLVLVL